jgi:hypothetical protein
MREAIERLDLIGQKWIDDIATIPLAALPPTLYHYTDSAGLHGMLLNGKIWLTQSYFLNDSTEGSHFVEQGVNFIRDRKNKNRKSAFDKFYEIVLEKLPEAWDRTESYIFSLSERRDDLSQWRGYAREGSGFTIGFDGASLRRSSRGRDLLFHFAKIEYSHDRQVEIVRRIVEEIEQQIDAEIAADPGIDQDELHREAARTCVWALDNRSAFAKHRSFSGEAEWRLVIYKELNSDGILVRPSGAGLVPYVQTEPTDAKGKLPIIEIGVGPGFVNSKISTAVEALCRQGGHSPNIYYADTPFRRP